MHRSRTTRRKRRPLTEAHRTRIVDLRTHGWTLEEIAAWIGCSHSTVLRVLEADAAAWADED